MLEALPVTQLSMSKRISLREIFLSLRLEMWLSCCAVCQLNCGLRAYQACNAVVVDMNQELCREWMDKPSAEKQFDPFYRAISAVAFSSGIKLKTRAVVLNSV